MSICCDGVSEDSCIMNCTRADIHGQENCSRMTDEVPLNKLPEVPPSHTDKVPSAGDDGVSERCSVQKLAINISSEDLNSVPDSVFDVADDIAELDMAYNSLVAIPESLCQSLINVTSLSIAGNELQELPRTISSLSQLVDLNVSSNKLASFPSSIVSLSKLCTLNFSVNEIARLPAEFGRLTALDTVVGYENQLQQLPDTFGLLRRLSTLELNDNRMTYLPRNFGFLSSLKILNLSVNKFSSLPDSFSGLKSLEVLDLTDNLLTSLPSRFRSCRHLRQLFLAKNSLYMLPEWFCDMPELEEIVLNGNQLVESPFPENFGDISVKLKTFEIAGNYVRRLPESLGRLLCLQSIHIGSLIGELERREWQNGNWIWKLPLNFGSLHALQHANLNENQICELPSDFGCLVMLEWLDLGILLLFCFLLSFKLTVSPKMFSFKKITLSIMNQVRDVNETRFFVSIPGKEFLDFRESRLTLPPDNRPAASGIIVIGRSALAISRSLVASRRLWPAY